MAITLTRSLTFLQLLAPCMHYKQILYAEKRINKVNEQLQHNTDERADNYRSCQLKSHFMNKNKHGGRRRLSDDDRLFQVDGHDVDIVGAPAHKR